MAILHYRITKANQSVNLNNHIHSQAFTFKRATVVMNPQSVVSESTPPVSPATKTTINQVDTLPILKGGIIVNPSYLSGFEIISGDNTSQNDIVIGLDSTKHVTDTYYDMNFDSEDVPEAFTVTTFNFDKSDQVTFAPLGGAEGTIVSIDLFFEFQSVGELDGY